ncbi:MAG: DUF4258 domain-containing protein [DPANN group archaeon]|nr:DUF4258 domain-containing protein [DPANN group archaeon]
MDIIFTFHANEQIRERKIHLTWIKETIKFPDDIMRVGKKCYATKRLNGLSLKVVYVKEKHIKVITSFYL